MVKCNLTLDYNNKYHRHYITLVYNIRDQGQTHLNYNKDKLPQFQKRNIKTDKQMNTTVTKINSFNLK